MKTFSLLATAFVSVLGLAALLPDVLAAPVPLSVESKTKRTSDQNVSKLPAYEAVPCVHVEKTHILRVPVTVNGTVNTYFILDTGAGVNLISKELAEKLGAKKTGGYRGQRMSGQTIPIDMSRIDSLSFGGYTRKDLPMGLWNMKELFENEPAFANIEGIVSLNFFKDCALTVDYQNNQAKVESSDSLAKLVSSGAVVPVKVSNKKKIDTSIMLRMQLPGDQNARCEVDTGSGSLILHTRYMKSLGIDPNSGSVKTNSGKDETGHSYTRYFTKLNAKIHPVDAPTIVHTEPNVQFQKIIYDGLIGDEFLRNFTVTYDLPNSRMIFSKN
ncbi:MAG: retropepsin-like domain-containing protein [Candidatus Obscuribacterales bacterium]|nr:retropepsin-like domain-containing protein [Candidatus Obscuribacterales bacterium]